jgi:Family of unknown function (DUF6444)
VTDALPGDPRDALIAAQTERIEALEALVADLREQLAAALRAGSRNSGNSSMPPSSDDLPGRKPAVHRRAWLGLPDSRTLYGNGAVQTACLRKGVSQDPPGGDSRRRALWAPADVPYGHPQTALGALIDLTAKITTTEPEPATGQ